MKVCNFGFELKPTSTKFNFTLTTNVIVAALTLETIMASSLASGAELTPESLAMARQRIVLSDTSLRVSNPYGAASPRDWTVCGIKRLMFPPAVLVKYRFGLAIREHATNTLILDNQDKYENPLYLNQNQKDSKILLSQTGHWQPHLYTRSGTFHQYLFGLRPRCDGILEVQPSCQADLGDASIKGYRFRGRVYDVTMSAGGFVVSEQGRETASGKPGEKVICGQK